METAEITPETKTDWACNVAIVGRSGTGKTSSLEQLPTDRTLILNVENKRLPFKTKFKHEYRIKDYRKLIGDNNEGMLVSGIKSDKFDYIVIDSFTTWAEMVLDFAKKYETGYDIYNRYNDEVSKLMNVIKFQESKIIFVLGIPENVEGMDGLIEKRLKVAGKQWEGSIEKEFPIVFYTSTRKDEENMNYFFETQTDGVTSAKSPRGMFESELIPNDLNQVANTIKGYYK